MLNCYVKFILLYDNECGVIFSQLKRWLEENRYGSTEVMLGIPWTEHVTKKEVLRLMKTKRKHLKSERKI